VIRLVAAGAVQAHPVETQAKMLGQMVETGWPLQLRDHPLLVLAAAQAAEIQAQDQAAKAAEETEQQVRAQPAAQGQPILAQAAAAVIRQAQAAMVARA
jgi:hypothetical protein